ncbi:MAG: family transposase [Chlorobi bacterium]|nr:family transposase [Chlorobiota bacterium]
MLIDALGNPLRFLLSPGQTADITSSPSLIEGYRSAALIADRAYDSDAFINLLSDSAAEAVIPSCKHRKRQRVIDRNLYRDRNKVERFFAWVKLFRRIATRYEKTAGSYLALVHLAGAMFWLR